MACVRVAWPPPCLLTPRHVSALRDVPNHVQTKKKKRCLRWEGIPYGKPTQGAAVCQVCPGAFTLRLFSPPCAISLPPPPPRSHSTSRSPTPPALKR
jgi:hypothetical protein